MIESMADFALLRVRGIPIFSLRRGYQNLILFLFGAFLIAGQFFRLIRVPVIPSSFSLLEALLYLFVLPIYLSKLRKSFFFIAITVFSTTYGSFLHGFDSISVFYAIKLSFMIMAGVVIGEILHQRYGLEECLDFFLRTFTVLLLIGGVIFFVFPKAHLFFAYIENFGIRFYGDPHERRFISPLFDPNYYAAVACLPLILSWIRKKYLLSFFFLLSILLTFSRSGIATCFVLLLFRGKNLPLFILGVLFGTIFFYEEIASFWGRIVHIAADESALARLDTFKTGAAFFLRHPFFGVGYHYSSPLFFAEFGRLAPDSSILITLIDFGLIPTLFFLFCAFFWSIRKLQSSSLFNWLYAYLILCIFFTSQFNNLLYYQYWLIPMIALFTFERMHCESRVRS